MALIRKSSPTPVSMAADSGKTSAAASREADVQRKRARTLGKQQQAAERRLAREKERLEKKIEELEAEIESLQNQMCQPAVLADPRRLTELSETAGARQEELDTVYEEWMELEAGEE